MAKKGENIYKRKDGRWEGRYIRWYEPTGKPKWGYVYAKTYGAAKQKLQAARTVSPAQPSTQTAETMAQVGALWLQAIQTRVKESTYVKYCNMLDTHILPQLGTQPFCQIQTPFLEAYLTEKARSGRLDGCGGLSPKTLQDLLSLLGAIGRFAQQRGIPTAYQTSEIHIPTEYSEMQVLTPAEQQQLTTYLLAAPDCSKWSVLLGLYVGLRVGELCALQWGDLSFSEKTVTVRHTMQRIRDLSGGQTKTKVIITNPKSRRSMRKIPIPEPLLTYISHFYENSHPSQDAYLLTGDPCRFVEPRTLQNRFKRYLKECGLPAYPFHALRHTFATRCVEVGFDVKSLSEILGHATVQITLDRYVHASFERKRQHMNLLSSYMTNNKPSGHTVMVSKSL